MPILVDRREEPTAIRTDLGAIFVSMELSRSSWMITSLSPGNGEKMSKHVVRGGDVAGLLARFSQLKEKARVRTGRFFPIIVIQEAGLDGFWIHRVLQNEKIESHVVDPASIATSRRRRRAKTDRIDGEALIRALLAYKRGEPRVCAMVNPRLRTTMIQLAWLWLRHQPRSALSRWFNERVERNGGRLRKTTIVALARKLLVALWKYVSAGVVIEGAVVRSA